MDADYRSSILIIYTGGTIGMKTDEKTGSSIPGILQARTLEWVTISFSNA